MRTKYPAIRITEKQAKLMHLNLDQYPNAGPRPNITGMRRFWGTDARVIICGSYAYHVPADVYQKVGGEE